MTGVKVSLNTAGDKGSIMRGKNIAVPAVCILLISCMVFAGCTETEQESSQTATPTEVPITTERTAAVIENVVDANDIFAFDIYKKIAGESPGDRNIFISPFSISSAFALVYEGARGDTAEEIGSVFYFPENTDTLRGEYMEINAGINAGDPAYELKVANALWAEKTYAFLDSYINTAEEYYSANTTNLDFINHTEESRSTINRWVGEKTNDKIQELVPAGMIDSATRLVVTNAIYFRGTWTLRFDENRTSDANFTTASGDLVTVRMMQKTATYGYAENEDLQALKMPYEHESGKELSMLVLLPKENDLQAVEDALDFEKFKEIEDSMSSGNVQLFFPRFKLETKYLLSDTLKKMGMKAPFSDMTADFSGMDGTNNLYIGEAIHKASVEVNEEGTEAAAATAVVVHTAAPPPGYSVPIPVFRADHPFIFLIQDDETGNILFIGRISNPQ